MEKQGGMHINDYKARSPYVMFRPVPNRITGFKDFIGLCQDLSASRGNPHPNPGLRLLELMPAKLQGRIDVIAKESKLQESDPREFIGWFNRIIFLPEFYKREYFSGVELPEKFRCLVEMVETSPKKLSPDETASLNLYLLLAAFPRFIGESNIINSWGFFSPEIPQEKKPGEFRIAMLGGSMVFCGDTHVDTTPAHLAQVLKNREPSLRNKTVTYLNAGLPSGVSGQELAQLIWHVLPRNIDLLVVFDGFNDLFLPINGYDRRPGYPSDYIVEEYRYYKFASKPHLVDALLSPFWEFLKRVRPSWVVDEYYRELNIQVPSVDKVMPMILDNYFENIQKMAVIANAYNIKAALFLQPFSPKHNDPARPDVKLLLKLYNEAALRFQKLSRGNNSLRVFQDLSSMREEMADLFVDVVHYRQTPGNTIVAERMYEVMKEAGMFKEHRGGVRQ
ncbi:MAG: SGNH/GDSL hydrolase family protein [Thermodesulfobacteriota bacterium]